MKLKLKDVKTRNAWNRLRARYSKIGETFISNPKKKFLIDGIAAMHRVVYCYTIESKLLTGDISIVTHRIHSLDQQMKHDYTADEMKTNDQLSSQLRPFIHRDLSKRQFA